MHCLPSCHQINDTHSGMNRMTAIVCYMGQHVRWCDWPVTQNCRYWHHKIGNTTCLNSVFLSQFMLKWNSYKHICLFAFVCYWCLLIISSFDHLTTNNHAEVSGLTEKCRSFLEVSKYCWSVSMAFTVWLQVQHGAKIECAILQSVRLCDHAWQRVVCGLSVVFHCRRYTAFGMWWHTVTHGRGSEGETGEWSG